MDSGGILSRKNNLSCEIDRDVIMLFRWKFKFCIIEVVLINIF